MNVAFYSAAAGMQAFQDKLDVSANNMANLNTTGYKNMEASFQDLLYSDMNTKVEGNHAQGHGSRVGEVNCVFRQGVLTKTERALDFAIAGQAYFAVDNGSGNIMYTRDGAFMLNMQGQDAYLTTGDGGYVLDGNGQRIQVPMIPGTNNADLNSIYNRIGLYTFANPSGLQPAGNNLYRESDNTGARASVESNAQNRLVQNALEASAVDMGDGMITVIEAQRAFQMNGRIVTTADQLEEMINNLR